MNEESLGIASGKKNRYNLHKFTLLIKFTELTSLVIACLVIAITYM